MWDFKYWGGDGVWDSTAICLTGKGEVRWEFGSVPWYEVGVSWVGGNYFTAFVYFLNKSRMCVLGMVFYVLCLMTLQESTSRVWCSLTLFLGEQKMWCSLSLKDFHVQNHSATETAIFRNSFPKDWKYICWKISCMLVFCCWWSPSWVGKALLKGKV